jgi:hypothetical protein
VQGWLEDKNQPKHYCCLGVLSVIIDNRYRNGDLAYPDLPIAEQHSVCTHNDLRYVIPLNDDGPLDNYSRVLWLLQEAPELFLS